MMMMRLWMEEIDQGSSDNRAVHKVLNNLLSSHTMQHAAATSARTRVVTTLIVCCKWQPLNGCMKIGEGEGGWRQKCTKATTLQIGPPQKASIHFKINFNYNFQKQNLLAPPPSPFALASFASLADS
jgi:hypothetical protein